MTIIVVIPSGKWPVHRDMRFYRAHGAIHRVSQVGIPNAVRVTEEVHLDLHHKISQAQSGGDQVTCYPKWRVGSREVSPSGCRGSREWGTAGVGHSERQSGMDPKVLVRDSLRPHRREEAVHGRGRAQGTT